MGWIQNVIFFPFSFYMIIVKFVFRITVKLFREMFTQAPPENPTEDSARQHSNPEAKDLKSRKMSVFEPRSRTDSGIVIRSRNNSGNSDTVRSRNNSGNESRSRHNSGPGPGLLQRSDSIVQFPVSPPSSGIGTRNVSRRSSCSGRVITIQVDKKFREEKLKLLQQKLVTLAAERNEVRYVRDAINLCLNKDI